MKYEEMDDLVDDTLLNPDYDPEADALPKGGIDELVKFMDEDEDEPDDDFGFPDSEVTKGNLIVGEDVKKSQPGPMDVHTAVGMFVTKKKKRKKIGKSFDEIYKARAKSGYAPGKNPNSHKRKNLASTDSGLASTAKQRMADAADAARHIEGGFASNGQFVPAKIPKPKKNGFGIGTGKTKEKSAWEGYAPSARVKRGANPYLNSWSTGSGKTHERGKQKGWDMKATLQRAHLAMQKARQTTDKTKRSQYVEEARRLVRDARISDRFKGIKAAKR